MFKKHISVFIYKDRKQKRPTRRKPRFSGSEQLNNPFFVIYGVFFTGGH